MATREVGDRKLLQLSPHLDTLLTLADATASFSDRTEERNLTLGTFDRCPAIQERPVVGLNCVADERECVSSGQHELPDECIDIADLLHADSPVEDLERLVSWDMQQAAHPFGVSRKAVLDLPTIAAGGASNFTRVGVSFDQVSQTSATRRNRVNLANLLFMLPKDLRQRR